MGLEMMMMGGTTPAQSSVLNTFAGADFIVKEALNKFWQQETGRLSRLRRVVYRKHPALSPLEIRLRVIELARRDVESRLQEVTKGLSQLDTEWMSGKEDEDEQVAVAQLNDLLSGRAAPEDNTEARLVNEIRHHWTNEKYYERALEQLENGNPNLLPLFIRVD
ncbi:MAG: hypothetical protein ACOX0Z_03910 [Candidatus Nanosyncoccaceae bacterium]|jgi:hypothetical protein